MTKEVLNDLLLGVGKAQQNCRCFPADTSAAWRNSKNEAYADSRQYRFSMVAQQPAREVK
jgi:hypothetical protein